MTEPTSLGRLLVLNVDVSGMNKYLYSELAKTWDLRIVDVPFPKDLSVRAVLPTFHPLVNRWKEKYHEMLARLYKLPSTFRQRGRFCEKILSQYVGTYDSILQISSMFGPSTLPSDVPFTLLIDYTMSQTLQQWPPWAPFTSERVAKEWLSLEKELYQRADRIFTPSKRTRQAIIQEYIVKPERVIQVGYGAPLDILPELELPLSEPMVLFVGMDFERKGGRVLLKAFERVRRAVPEARLLVVGPPPRVVGTVPEGVEVLGHVADRQRLQDLYRQAAVFILPSLCEPFGLVLLEAMAYVLPCIGTKVDAMSEIIVDGETGLIVPPGEATALAEAMKLLLTSHELRSRMGQAGRLRIEEQFTWERTTERISDELFKTTRGFMVD